MGDEPQYDYERWPGEDKAPLEGEVVVYRPQPRRRLQPRGPDIGFGHRPGSAESGKPFGPRTYDEELIREVLHHRVTHPHESIRQVAAQFGVHHDTVRRWTQETRPTPDQVALRRESADWLEACRAEAFKLFDACRGSRNVGVMRTALEALRAVESLTGTHAKLMGLNMPVKVDVQLTALTAAEEELQEMIREAQAKAVADEAAVIAQASEDPDL